MPLFSRKSSREATLEKIYRDAYQASMQSILKEANFEYAPSLTSWKATLAQISAGMATLDGSPPKTGQEKSLLASILDIERQCHDRISALEARLEAPRDTRSPYGTHVSGNPSKSGVNVSTTSISRKAVGSTPVTPATGAVPTKTPAASAPALSTSSDSSKPPLPPLHRTNPASSSSSSTSTAKKKPWASLSETSMPRVKDMPYNLYKRKPNPKPENPTQPAFKSASEYLQATTVQMPSQSQQRGMLTTLRSSNPLTNAHSKSRSRQQAQNQRSTPSPRSSGEDVATKAHQDLVRRTAQLATSQAEARQAEARQATAVVNFNGFDSAFGDGPSSPSSNQTPSPVEPSRDSSSPSPTYNGHAERRVNSYQITYTTERVPGSSRTISRPVVTRTTGPGGSTKFRPATPQSSHTSATPSTPSMVHAQSRPQKVLADGIEPDTHPKDTELDEWQSMVHEKIKELRGVDEKAALQIVNEVVLKGDPVHWDDIAGLEKAKAGLKETVVYPFLRPDLFSGLREPALGMLLFGPPGTGKTMLARAVATESRSTFFSISASSLTSKFLGESEKLVRALFQLAKALAPSIIFVDEIDSILTQRADSGEHEASRRIKNEFLVQWSDLQTAAAGKNNADSNVRRVLVLGATNLPWAIDEAARRRFVRRQYIPLPEAFTRKVHLEKLLSHQKHALTEADIVTLVEATDGYSGSDLTALAKDAAMGPLRSLGDALLTTAPDQVRPMGVDDFRESMRTIRPSVSPEGLSAFENWAQLYGSSGA